MSNINYHILAIGVVTTVYILFNLLHMVIGDNNSVQGTILRGMKYDFRKHMQYIQRYPRGVPYVLFEYDMMNIIKDFRNKYKKRVNEYTLTKHIGQIIESAYDKEYELYKNDKPSIGHTFIHSLNKK